MPARSSSRPRRDDEAAALGNARRRNAGLDDDLV
ncbi:MAG: hypothetical protein ACI9MR_003446, partial [Myxococcota bacterium]